MGTPFLSEIRIVSFNFAPQGWAECNGQFLPINQNQPLFALLGTTYGGNGQTTFALPDLRGRIPMHSGNYTPGTALGQAAHTVTIAEMPTHTHFVNASTTQADQNTGNVPASNLMFSKSTGSNFYASATNLAALDPQSVSSVGGSQAHDNQSPYLALVFCIALQGLFPSQN
jgi:microcystin-dependent protein